MGKNTILQPSWLRAGKFPRGERNLKMRVRTSLLGALLVIVALALPAFSEIMQQADTPGQSQSQAPTGTQTTTLPAQSQQPQGSFPLRVMVGKSLLINTTERLKRISITDPSNCLRSSHYADADSGSWQVSGRSFAHHLG